jgi:hypothetical protein
MNFIGNVLIIVVLALIAFTVPGYSQTNFSGTWNLKEKQHIKGPEYANGAPAAFSVEQSKDSIVITYPENNSRVSFALDGKATSNIGAQSGRKVVRSLKWSADKKTVTFTSDIYKAGNENEIELTRIDAWSLSPDGKQLNFHRNSVETITESWEVKGVYGKE